MTVPPVTEDPKDTTLPNCSLRTTVPRTPGGSPGLPPPDGAPPLTGLPRNVPRDSCRILRVSRDPSCSHKILSEFMVLVLAYVPRVCS